MAVLFADLAGFTKLTSEADAEVVHGLLGRFFELVDGAIARHGGSVDKHIGDATMGVFGAPVAHGNDVERAVSAACEIHEAIAALSAELGKPLATHIGIASGEVVAASTGSAVRADYTVTGDAVNLASRLEELAGAGETIVSDDVRAALGPRLDAESRGSVAVRGFAREMPVWRVRALRGQAAARHRIVGRARELARFADALDDAVVRRRGATLVLRGDPGVGKSRLAEAMLEHAAARGCARHGAGVLDFGASSRRDAASLLARALLDLAPTAGPDACRAALDRAVSGARIDEAREPFVADLVGIEQRAGSRYDAMDHAARARGRIDALAALVASAASERPVAILVEDVHWAGSALLDALAALRDRARSLPLVLVLTTRREPDPLAAAWRATDAAVLDLAPLSTDEALELAAAFLEARPDVARRCVERAQGNPLFLTQLLQSGADDGAIPGTIRNVVLARLDRLPAAERAALQAASIAGQRFDLALVAHLTGAPAPLTQARARDLVRGGGSGDELVFSHALIRDAAYASLLHSARRDLHARAAGWFAGRDPVLRAEHLERAEDPLAPQAFLEAAQAMAAALRPDDALALAQRGSVLAKDGAVAHALALVEGELARDLGDPSTAVAAFGRATELACDERERCVAWIGVASAHRLSSTAAEGFAALDAAQAIAERLGLARERARIAYLRGSLHFQRGDLERCASEHERSLALAREAGDEACEAQALSGLADALYASGRLRSALAAFERCVALCDRRGDTRFALMNRLMIGLLDFYEGRADRALARFDGVRATAREIGHRVAEVMADECAGMVLSWSGSLGDAVDALERSLGLARAISSRRFVAFDLAFLGRLGRHDDRDLARARLDEAWSVLEDVGPDLAGAVVFAARACLAESDAGRREALARGEALLKPNALSHNHLWFRADAIDATLDAGDLDETLRHAQALEDYSAREPTAWSEFVVARARALVAAKRGARDAAVLRELRERALALRLVAALPSIEAALAG
ncbi:MAG TPA: adenylate/guanylate cyclase domain-containing protein [Casimicrobiaceae bacterium]|nr:adenylate/guanylate cyclase domain-containing protein [Casimicrobiaceae bacterium]